MKRSNAFHKIIAILFFVSTLLIPVILTGCAGSPPQVVAVQTIKAVGESAEASVQLAGQLYKNGTISLTQAQSVRDMYDNKFQPAFKTAKDAALSDLSLASPDLITISQDLANLVAGFQKSST